MSILEGFVILVGAFTIANEPIPNQSFLCFDLESFGIIGWGKTGPEGKAELSLPDDYQGKKVGVLLKANSPELVGLEYREVEVGEVENLDFSLNADDFCLLEISVNVAGEMPPFVELFLDPQSVKGVPEEITKKAKFNTATSKNSYFFKQQANPRQTYTLKVNPGTYNVGGMYQVFDQPLTAEGSPNLVTGSAMNLNLQEPLQGNIYLGYSLDIQADTKVELTLIPEAE